MKIEGSKGSSSGGGGRKTAAKIRKRVALKRQKRGLETALKKGTKDALAWAQTA